MAGEPDVDSGQQLKTLAGKNEDLGILPLYMLLSGGRETAQCPGTVVLLTAALAILSITRMPVPSTKN